MAKQLFANNVSTQIMEFLSASDTTITVSSTSRFPSLGTGDWIMATVVPTGGQGSPEVVKITAISGNDLTVVRAQEGTTAQSFLYGSLLELRVTRGSLEYLRDRSNYVDVKRDYGAVGDGSTDDTAAIQAAVDFAETLGNAVFLPQGEYLISNTVVFEQGIHFFGEGLRSIIKVKATVGATIDALKISPSTTTNDRNTDFVFEDFMVTPESGTPGRHAIAIDITTRAAYSCRFRGLRLNALGGRGIVTLPNASPLTDGFFSSVIEHSTIYNGIYLDKAGDSLRILHNTITGSNVGIYVDLVSVPSDGGAHSLEIIGNNITSNGGALLVKNAWTGRFLYNNVEIPAPSGITNNAVIDIDGTSAGNKTNNFVVAHNFAAAAINIDVVRVNNSRRTLLFGNYFAEPGGTGKVYQITANADDTHIVHDCTALDSAQATLLSDAGTRTTWIRQFGGKVEFSNDIYLIGSDKRIRGRDSAGNDKAILGVNVADNTCVVGFVDAPATNGHLRLYANGAEAARISPSKEIIVNDVTPTGGTVKLTVNGDVAVKGATTGTTVGAAGGASALPATPTGYLVLNINGTDRKIPFYNT